MSVQRFITDVIRSGITFAPFLSGVRDLRLAHDDRLVRFHFLDRFHEMPAETLDVGQTPGRSDINGQIGKNRNLIATVDNLGAVTLAPGGGIVLTTGDATDDDVVIHPAGENSNGLVPSALASVSWDYGKAPHFRTLLRTGNTGNIQSVSIIAGFVDATDFDDFDANTTGTGLTSDADVCAVAVTTNSSGEGNWKAISSRGAAPNLLVTDTGKRLAANTDYFIEILVDAARRPEIYINHQLVARHPKMDASPTAFIPVVGIRTEVLSFTKSMTLRFFECGQAY